MILIEKIFFQFDSAGLRGHDCKLFKKRFILNVRNFSCSTEVFDNWNCLSAHCVTSGKNHVQESCVC